MNSVLRIIVNNDKVCINDDGLSLKLIHKLIHKIDTF